ncbi:MAG: hypothetical protein QM775_33820 [Pirellulales bacterium]
MLIKIYRQAVSYDVHSVFINNTHPAKACCNEAQGINYIYAIIHYQKLFYTARCFSIFTQPYPNYNTTNSLPKNSLIICIAVFLFLFLFRPFGVNPDEHTMNYVFICLIHAANAALIYFVFFFLLNKFAASWVQEEKWKVNKAIIIISILFFFIGLGSFLVRDIIYTNPDNFSWKYFVAETINTFLAGTLVSGGFILFDFYRAV